MGTMLYRPGSKQSFQVFDGSSVEDALKNGWVYDPYEKPIKSVKLSDNEIRQDAKSKGIKNWYNKKIDKLKAEIDACQP